MYSRAHVKVYEAPVSLELLAVNTVKNIILVGHM